MVQVSGAGIDPPHTTRTGYDMYGHDGFNVGDRVTLRPEFNENANYGTGAAGKVVRIDDGSAFPIIVWLDEFGPATPVERAARTGLPVCADDIEHVQ